jgi:integrase
MQRWVEKALTKLEKAKREPKIRTQRGKSCFYCEYTTGNGERVQFSYLESPDFNARIQEEITKLLHGEYKGKVDNEVFVAEAFDVYLRESRLPALRAEYSEEKQKKYYLESYRVAQYITDILQTKCNIIILSKINKDSMRILIENIRISSQNNEKINSNSTCNRYIMPLVAMNNYIKNHTEYKYCELNLGLFKQKEPPPMTNYLKDDEIEKLLEYSPEHLRKPIIFALNTGFRKQNIFSLKWDDVDFENKIITQQVKQNKTHTVPMTSDVYQMLIALSQEKTCEYVFTYLGKKLTTPRRSFKTALKSAGIELPIGQLFHVFRHTSASKMINAGVDILTVSKVLGHSSVSMTQKYAHLSADSIREKMEKALSKPLCELSVNCDEKSEPPP